MSWRDQFRRGSFRGVEFFTEEVEGETGRRVQIHQYPQRDLPFAEDLGRASRSFGIECFVAGDDYHAQRDRLIEACEAEGLGTLVHPFRGELQVVCTDCQYRESAVSGGIATFSLSFTEAGAPVIAPVAADTARIVAQTADAAHTAAARQLEHSFSVAGVSSVVEEAAAEIVAATALVTRAGSFSLGGGGAALLAFEAGMAWLPGGAVALVRSPLALAAAVSGMLRAFGELGHPRRRIDGLLGVIAATLRLPPVIGATRARIRQRSNQAALQALILTSTSAEIVRAVAAVQFGSYDEAVALRDRVDAALDEAALVLADRHADEAAGQIDALRRAMVRDVTARGGSLARIDRWQAPRVLPALTIAQLIDARPETVPVRAAELVERNRIRHPGFVPADTLEVTRG